MIEHYHSLDGLKLAFNTFGEGPQVLCLAGVTRNSNDFRHLARKFPNLQLICLDYRGRGESEWDPNPDHYSPSLEAADAISLLDHLGIGCIPVIGTSRGGIVATLMPQDRISAIVFNDIGPIVERDGLVKIVDYIGKNPSAQSYEDMAEILQREMVGFDDVPLKRWLEEARTHFVQTEEGLKINYDPDISIPFKATFRGEKFSFLDQFRALGPKPMGVLRGSNSTLLSTKTVDLMKELHPHILSAEVPNRGHIPFLDEPESVQLISRVLGQLPEFHFLNSALPES